MCEYEILIRNGYDALHLIVTNIGIRLRAEKGICFTQITPDDILSQMGKAEIRAATLQYSLGCFNIRQIKDKKFLLNKIKSNILHNNMWTWNEHNLKNAIEDCRCQYQALLDAYKQDSDTIMAFQDKLLKIACEYEQQGEKDKARLYKVDAQEVEKALQALSDKYQLAEDLEQQAEAGA